MILDFVVTNVPDWTRNWSVYKWSFRHVHISSYRQQFRRYFLILLKA